MKAIKEKSSSASTVSRHKIRDAIQGKIFRGDYPSGSRLTQIQLSKEYKVSMTVIRESLLELRAMGMVELKDQLGAFVREVDARKLLQAYEIREMLEGLAARLCCDHANRAEVRELEQIAEKLRQLPPEERKERYSLDREFHQKIMHFSQNDMLIQLSECYQILGKVVKMNEQVPLSPETHYLIVESIRENRPDEAERRMREHIRSGRRDLERNIADGKFQLQWVE
ncbi:MAG: GntR family transcriptional regulator [Phycisphaerae bacterium]|nr:GntR family transcriptional regulator [Phycisphaerae bacterium]